MPFSEFILYIFIQYNISAYNIFIYSRKASASVFCLLLLSLPASLLSVMVCVVGLSPGQYFYFQEVFPTLAAKQCIMQANAEYHQSILAKQQKKFGEEIARLQVSLLVINV